MKSLEKCEKQTKSFLLLRKLKHSPVIIKIYPGKCCCRSLGLFQLCNCSQEELYSSSTYFTYCTIIGPNRSPYSCTSRAANLSFSQFVFETTFRNEVQNVRNFLCCYFIPNTMAVQYTLKRKRKKLSIGDTEMQFQVNYLSFSQYVIQTTNV